MPRVVLSLVLNVHTQGCAWFVGVVGRRTRRYNRTSSLSGRVVSFEVVACCSTLRSVKLEEQALDADVKWS